MSRAEWELIEMARARALADRYQREALAAAEAVGIMQSGDKHAYALGWLAMRCADRQVRLEAAREQAYDEGVSTGKGMQRVEDAQAIVVAASAPSAAQGTSDDDPEVPLGAGDLGGAPTPRLVGLKAEQQHGNAVPKDAARAHDAASPATPPPPRPQGVAGHPPARESRLRPVCEIPDCGCSGYEHP